MCWLCLASWLCVSCLVWCVSSGCWCFVSFSGISSRAVMLRLVLSVFRRVSHGLVVFRAVLSVLLELHVVLVVCWCFVWY